MSYIIIFIVTVLLVKLVKSGALDGEKIGSNSWSSAFIGAIFVIVVCGFLYLVGKFIGIN